MSLQEKIENLETDLHLMGRLVLDALVDGVRALEDKDVNRAIATIEKMMKSMLLTLKLTKTGLSLWLQSNL